MEDSIYKNFEIGDVFVKNNTEQNPLFGDKKGITVPYTSASGLEISTTNTPSSNEEFFNQIHYVNKLNSSLNYFSAVSAVKEDYANSSGSAMSYWNMVNLASESTTTYTVNDGISNYTSSAMTIIALNREFYEDGIDENNFSVLISTGSGASPATPITNGDFKLDVNGVSSLFMDTTNTSKKNSNIGDRYYLYPLDVSEVPSSTVIYDKDTDTFLHQDSSKLNKTKPFGEVFLEHGLVVLYNDIIKSVYPDINEVTPLSFVAGIVGRSVVENVSNIYISRIKLMDFNYSNNHTFLESDGEVKEIFKSDPKVFITGIGLYNEKDELIAFGKLSTPLLKDFSTEYIFKMELTY